MLACSSKHVRCDAGVKRSAVSITRAVPRSPCSTSSTAPLLQRRVSPHPCQQRAASLVLVRSAESASAAVTTTTTPAPAAADPAAAPQLQELNKDTFQPFLDAAGDKLVVVDFFTDWCGPCKLIYPQLVALSAELEPAATIVKFNCNQYNKELAKALGIKVAPTFHLYKQGQKVADMTGAKVDKLRALIDDHLKPQEAAAGGDN